MSVHKCSLSGFTKFQPPCNRPFAQWRHVECQNNLPNQAWIKLYLKIQVDWSGSRNELKGVTPAVQRSVDLKSVLVYECSQQLQFNHTVEPRKNVFRFELPCCFWCIPVITVSVFLTCLIASLLDGVTIQLQCWNVPYQCNHTVQPQNNVKWWKGFSVAALYSTGLWREKQYRVWTAHYRAGTSTRYIRIVEQIGYW